MPRLFRSLAVGFLAITALSANAQLTSAQMEAARAFITNEKFVIPHLKFECLRLRVPTTMLQTQEELEKLHEQLQVKSDCVGEIRTMTYEPNLRSMLETEFPKATGSQTSELTTLAMETMEPIRKRVTEDLQSTRARAMQVAGPFLARLKVEKAFQKEADACNEPPPRTFSSTVASEIYLEGYRLFEKCLNRWQAKLENFNDKAFVNGVFGDEPEAVRSYVLAELPGMKERAIKSYVHRLALSRTPRAIAQAYHDAHKNDDTDEGWDEDDAPSKSKPKSR